MIEYILNAKAKHPRPSVTGSPLPEGTPCPVQLIVQAMCVVPPRWGKIMATWPQRLFSTCNSTGDNWCFMFSWAGFYLWQGFDMRVVQHRFSGADLEPNAYAQACAYCIVIKSYTLQINCIKEKRNQTISLILLKKRCTSHTIPRTDKQWPMCHYFPHKTHYLHASKCVVTRR